MRFGVGAKILELLSCLILFSCAWLALQRLKCGATSVAAYALPGRGQLHTIRSPARASLLGVQGATRPKRTFSTQPQLPAYERMLQAHFSQSLRSALVIFLLRCPAHTVLWRFACQREHNAVSRIPS